MQKKVSLIDFSFVNQFVFMLLIVILNIGKNIHSVYDTFHKGFSVKVNKSCQNGIKLNFYNQSQKVFQCPLSSFQRPVCGDHKARQEDMH